MQVAIRAKTSELDGRSPIQIPMDKMRMIQKRRCDDAMAVWFHFWYTFGGLGTRKVSRESNSVVGSSSFQYQTSARSKECIAAEHDFDHGGADWALLNEFDSLREIHIDPFGVQLFDRFVFCWVLAISTKQGVIFYRDLLVLY
jgi:hypothetical protein